MRLKGYEMKAKMRLSLRQISAIIVLPLVMVACGRTEKNVQGDQSITFGVEITQSNKSLYDGTMSTVQILQIRDVAQPDGSIAKYEYKCSGTVIEKNLILTAAHCLSFPLAEAPMYVEFPFTKQEVKLNVVVDLLQHENFDHKSKQNDLMLLKMEGTIPADYLPMQVGSLRGYVPFGNLTIFGFGRSKSPNFSNQNDQGEESKLRTTKVSLFSRENLFLKFDQRKNGGSCMGDSGGPAVMRDGYRPVLVGVASNVYPDISDAQDALVQGPRYNGDVLMFVKDHPEIEICKGYSHYVDLSLYRDWIDDGIEKLR